MARFILDGLNQGGGKGRVNGVDYEMTSSGILDTSSDKLPIRLQNDFQVGRNASVVDIDDKIIDTNIIETLTLNFKEEIRAGISFVMSGMGQPDEVYDEYGNLVDSDVVSFLLDDVPLNLEQLENDGLMSFSQNVTFLGDGTSFTTRHLAPIRITFNEEALGLFKSFSFADLNSGIESNGIGLDTIILSDLSPVCFARGTLITTDSGDKPIEDLLVGDLILTLDSGYEPIRWIGSSILSEKDLIGSPKLKPIRITVGALGSDLPKQDLLLSPQHRVLVKSKTVQSILNTEETLIAANKLIKIDGIYIEDCSNQSVEYFHILLDNHEIIFSNGALTESLFLGPQALKSVSPKAREEIESIFPKICDPTFLAQSVRPFPEKGILEKQISERHSINREPLYKNI